MPFYLLQENGDKLLLEDGSGFLILETVSTGPTVNYQGGAGYPVRQRRRREADHLFTAIERSLQEAMGLVPPRVEGPVQSVEAVREEADATPWSDHAIQATLGQLHDLAQGHADLERRLGRLKILLAAHAHAEAVRTDEEDAWILMA